MLCHLVYRPEDIGATAGQVKIRAPSEKGARGMIAFINILMRRRASAALMSRCENKNCATHLRAERLHYTAAIPNGSAVAGPDSLKKRQDRVGPAQLGERFNGIEEVVGSIPSGSTNQSKTETQAEAFPCWTGFCPSHRCAGGTGATPTMRRSLWTLGRRDLKHHAIAGSIIDFGRAIVEGRAIQHARLA